MLWTDLNIFQLQQQQELIINQSDESSKSVVNNSISLRGSGFNIYVISNFIGDLFSKRMTSSTSSVKRKPLTEKINAQELWAKRDSGNEKECSSLI